MDFLKRFTRNYFAFVGACTPLWIAASFILSAEHAVRLMRGLALMDVFLSAVCALLFRPGFSRKSLWLRRAAVIAVSCVFTPLSMLLTGAARFGDSRGYIVYLVSVVAAIALLTPAAYFVADRIEKRTLEKINRKLGGNK